MAANKQPVMGSLQLLTESQDLAGKKEKISKSDIVGFIANNSPITAQEIGKIDVKDHYAIVAVPYDKATQVLESIRTCKIKNKKVKIGFAKVL